MYQICIEKKFSYDNINIMTKEQYETDWENESSYDRPVLESEKELKGLLLGFVDSNVNIGDDILYKYEDEDQWFKCHYLGKIVYILEI